MRGRWRVLMVASLLLGGSATISWAQSASLAISVTVVRPCRVDVEPAAPAAASPRPGTNAPVALKIKCGQQGDYASPAVASGSAIVPGAPAPAILSSASRNAHQLLVIEF